MPTDLLVLPEMPFAPWTIFTKRVVDPVVWQQLVADHDAAVSRFGELATEVVLGSRPVEDGGRRLNQSFAWTRSPGVRSSRSKVYLPDAPDGWEATWFRRGTLDPSLLTRSFRGTSDAPAPRSSPRPAPPAGIVAGVLGFR